MSRSCPNCHKRFPPPGYGRCCSTNCVSHQNAKLVTQIAVNRRLVALCGRMLALSSTALADVMRRRREPGMENYGDEWLAANRAAHAELEATVKGHPEVREPWTSD